jgi:hypothetical protein
MFLVFSPQDDGSDLEAMKALTGNRIELPDLVVSSAYADSPFQKAIVI